MTEKIIVSLELLIILVALMIFFVKLAKMERARW